MADKYSMLQQGIDRARPMRLCLFVPIISPYDVVHVCDFGKAFMREQCTAAAASSNVTNAICMYASCPMLNN